MPYCSSCGIEVNDEVKKCPLCANDIQISIKEETPFKLYPSKPSPNSAAPRRNKKEQRRMAAILVTFGLLIPASIAIAADLVFNKEVTWGTYTIGSLIYIWVLVLLPLLYDKKPVLTMLAYYVSTLLFLYWIDAFEKGLFWFPQLAFPIVTMTSILIIVILFISKHSKIKGINILSYAVLSLGIECLTIDFSISLFLNSTIQFGWSLIVLSATIPAAGLLYYLYYKTKKPLKVKEYFHI